MKPIQATLAIAFIAITFTATYASAQNQQVAPTDEEKIADAMSAGPVAIAEDATIMDWPATAGGKMRVLREGGNGWVCYPSHAAVLAEGYKDSRCFDEAWQELLKGLMGRSEPMIEHVGIAYMLQGDGGSSNTDPFATGPTADNDWHVAGPHLMLLTSDPSELEGVPTDHHYGGPYVMWAGTPYQHIMVPTGLHLED